MDCECSTDSRNEKSHNILVGNLEGREHLEDLDVDGKTILERILRKYSESVWTGFIWLRTGTSGRLLWTR